MKKVLTLLVFSIVGCHAQSSNIQPTKELEVQDDAVDVFYKLKPSPTQTEYLDIQAKVREFIWKKWNSRQVGKLKLESYTKEGDKTLATFEILVTEGNKQRIEVSIERDYVGRNPRAEFYKQNLKDVKKYSATDIDRIKVPKDGLVKREIISGNTVLSPKLYMIRLKDSNGKILTEI